MNHRTKNGVSWPIVLGILFIIGAGTIYVFNRPSDARVQNAKNIAQDVAQKGTETLQEQGGVALERGKEIASDGREMAVTEGRKVVGEALKETGEKMTGVHDGVGTYGDYVPEKIIANNGAILDFSAPWCPSCRAFEKNITSNLDKIPSGVTILKVDFDTATDLKKKYRVTQQHTFVQVDKDGTLIKKWLGSPTIDHVVASMQK